MVHGIEALLFLGAIVFSSQLSLSEHFVLSKK